MPHDLSSKISSTFHFNLSSFLDPLPHLPSPISDLRSAKKGSEVDFFTDAKTRTAAFGYPWKVGKGGVGLSLKLKL
ncbi:MAG: hypothetical protein EBZ78_13370 [Verrucomicrobia bacterium]|nr:hypothetical protein [Verrucomicrobiota bacterium]